MKQKSTMQRFSGCEAIGNVVTFKACCVSATITLLI